MSSFNRRMLNGIGYTVIPQWLQMGAVGQQEVGTKRSTQHQGKVQILGKPERRGEANKQSVHATRRYRAFRRCRMGEVLRNMYSYTTPNPSCFPDQSIRRRKVTDGKLVL